MRIVAKGATSQSVYFDVLDSASTTGGRKTGLVFNTAGLTAYYVRSQGSSTSITLATLATPNAAFSSGGFVEVDATNMPGIYRLDIPNAAIAAGAGDSVAITIKGATGMVQATYDIQLSSVDLQDAVRAGLTSLPNTTNLNKTTNAICRGTVTTGASTVSVPTSSLSIASVTTNNCDANQFVGRVILFDGDTTTVGLRGQGATITASSSGTTPTFTVAAMTSAPANGDTFSIL